ncbi:MAG: GAF domain-containing protein [Anaerolineales bacterium]|nr:GAF domain-containing protein [Anaerolineales bacterium]
MFGLGSLSAGVTLLIVGAGFVILTLVVLRVVPRLRPLENRASSLTLPQDLPAHSDAILLVNPGGRVVYLNEEARRWFDSWEQQPNLERLVRRARPSDTFLGLCTSEGQARFSVDGRIVEATSYIVPNDDHNNMLISLRIPQVTTLGGEDLQTSNQTAEILAELSQAMATNLELEATLQSILSSVEQLIPTDFAEITIWEDDNQWLVPYRFIGLTGLDRRLERTVDRYPLGEGLSGYVARERQALLIADIDAERSLRPLIDRKKYPFLSYLAVPLLVGGDLVGTLDLTSTARNAFSQNDLEVLRLLSGQAAIALHNAITYQEEQRRADELASLANLSQAISSVRDSKELFTQLVQAIAPLLDIEIVGFLIYDESNRMLVAQQPFSGVPSQFVELYQVEIAADSPAEAIWSRQQTLISSNPTDDPLMADMGLQGPARAAGIHQTVLTPLASGGRVLGYLQAANKSDRTPFNQDDIRLLSIIAGQAAPIIENADLIQQSVQRALRAESLRRIASLSSSMASLDEILKYSILELARLFQADAAAIFILDENLSELQIHASSIYGVDPETAIKVSTLSSNDPDFRLTVTNSKRSFLSSDVTNDARIIGLYKPIIAALEVHSALVVPLVVRDRGLGELMMSSQKTDFFTPSDIQLAMTVAGQLAIAIERASLASQTDVDLRRRIDQLTALTRIARELNTTVDLSILLQRVHDEAIQSTRADCGSIRLFEPQAKLEERATRTALLIGDQAEGDLHWAEAEVLESGKAQQIDDFNNMPSDQRRAPHSGIRSALVVPIVYQEQIAGLIFLHARQPGQFDQPALQITQALAVQAALGLGNAQRYQDQVQRNSMLNQRVEILSNLFEASQKLNLDQPLAQSLEDVAYAIQSSTPFDVVLISTYESRDQKLHRLTGAGIALEDMEQLKTRPQPWQAVTELLQPEFQLGRSYFIPQDRRPVAIDQLHTLTVLPGLQSAENGDELRWHPKDLLLIPLLKASGEPLGMISVDGPRNGLRPDQAVIETLEIYAGQAALVIESQQRLLALAAQVNDLSQQIEQYSEIQKEFPALLQATEQQKATIAHLSIKDQRAQAGLTIIEDLSLQPDFENVLAALANGFVDRMGFSSALVANLGATGPQLISAHGELPAGINAAALLGQRNPVSYCLQEGLPLLVANLAHAPDWQNTPLLTALDAQALVCLPIQAQNRANAALLAIHNQALPAFNETDQQLFDLLRRQTALAINNLNLLTETGQRLREVNLLLDFSRQLGSLEPVRIINTLVESTVEVVDAAEATVVALFDPERNALVPQAARGYSDLEAIFKIHYRPGEALPGKAFQQGQAMRLDEVNFATDYNLVLDDLLNYREATGGRLPISSLIIPIRSGENVLGVMTIDNFTRSEAFSAEDLALVNSLTQQTALTLENVRLYQATEARAAQLQSLSEVASVITSSLEPEALVESLLEMLAQVVPFDTGTLWLRTADSLAIQAARGFENSTDLLGISTAVEDSRLFSEMIETTQPLLVADVRSDERFPGTEAERLSWLGVPLMTKGEVIGVIALEKNEANFYRQEYIQVAMTFASQAAVALENAKLFQQSVQRTEELDQRSQRLTLLNRFSNQISSTLDLDYLVKVTVDELLSALSATHVAALLWQDGRAILTYESPQVAAELPLTLPPIPLFEHLEQTLGIFNTQDASQEAELSALRGFLRQRQTRGLLVLPLATGDELHGFLLVQSDQPVRFSADEIELARIITNQAAVAVQNASLFAETRRLTAELEHRVAERTEQLGREHQRAQTLLRIMQELSASLDLDHVLNRTLAVLNETIGAQQATILLVKPGEQHFYYRAALGYTEPPPPGGRNSGLRVDEGIAGWVIQQREGLLITDLRTDGRWVHPGDERQSEHRSAIVSPLMVGAEALGALLLFHQQTGRFSEDQRELVQAAANQIAIAINNAELFNLIREQAESLGGMLRSQQVEASRSRSILEAVADGVLVTDGSNLITLFNSSAQQILNLERESVVGKSLDAFTGLFGQAAKRWKETIQGWSENPDSYEQGETFAERITLDNNRVVSIHLAPVAMRNEFLGTVSIFRDITHQVEVDRLKSEFVATVSHELRTPMTSIKGYVEILLMGAAGQLTTQQIQFLQVVKTNTERLNVLVNDLLDISRIEAGKVDLSFEMLDLREIAAEVRQEQLRRTQEDQKNMQIELDIPADLPRVEGDLERVRQVMSNLVSNGYHYTPPEGKIIIRLRRKEHLVQIDIQDNGIGIPPEDQQRVFERFFRGEDPLVLATAGTGLGLSITQQLVEMHHGRIWLESEGIPGLGSTFSFTLPIRQPATEQSE